MDLSVLGWAWGLGWLGRVARELDCIIKKVGIDGFISIRVELGGQGGWGGEGEGAGGVFFMDAWGCVH